MRILPLFYCPMLSEEEIIRHENSDRIWVSQDVFERWLLAEDEGSVVIVKLGSVAACMYGCHYGASNIIYAPTWICEKLHVYIADVDLGDEDEEDDESEHEHKDDYIEMTRFRPSMCTFLKVQPHTSEHLQIPDTFPEDALSRAFEEYTCIEEGQVLQLNLPSGNTMMVTIVETQGGSGPLCIRNTEIAMDLLEPLDQQRPPTPIPTFEPAVLFPPDFEEKQENQEQHEKQEKQEQQEAVKESREERREKLARAALARLTQKTAE